MSMLDKVLHNLKEIQRKEKAIDHWLKVAIDVKLPALYTTLYHLDLISENEYMEFENRILTRFYMV